MNPHRFDLVSLRLFIAVVDGGSLTAGAQAFGISLPAASKRIRELEAATGTVLLERGRGGARTTSAGATLYRHARTVAGEVAQMAVAMSDYARGVRGHLRIWANTSAVTGFLPLALATFLRDNPRIAVDLEEANSEPIVDAVRDGRAELGVFADNVASGGLQVAVCDIDRLVLLTPAGHPLARRHRIRFADTLAYDFIGLDRGSSLVRLSTRVAAEHQSPLKIRVHVRSFDAMARMIATGVGLGMLPWRGAAPHAASMGLRMIELDDPWALRRLLVGWRDREMLDGPARTLLDQLLARTTVPGG
ncbi:MAG TPA: LysR family transcriptional regulator [Burkholderiaceae bacterium]|nr:LysR family transcriptional regulator [Burkholderiaceae bacterium]